MDFVDLIYYVMKNTLQIMDSCLDEFVHNINRRFIENHIGYELYDGEIIRKGNEEYHTEVLAPAFGLLKGYGFEVADKELKKAFRFRREGDYTSAISEASKAFESVMKTICVNCEYEFKENDSPQRLVEVLVENNFIESYNMNQLIGVSTMRNKLAGHGDGIEEKIISEHQADYSINLAAANILFLVNRYKDFRIKFQ